MQPSQEVERKGSKMEIKAIQYVRGPPKARPLSIMAPSLFWGI